MLFLIKDTSVFRKSLNVVLNNQGEGLTYTTTLKELVYKDSDGDGVPDWEEVLYGLDPNKKETTSGIPDSTAMNKLKADQENNSDASGLNSQGDEKLTETDKFSRELFSTSATLNQGGAMDQATTDQISSSLSSKIQNNVQRKVFTLTDIKVINDNSKKAVADYKNTLNNIPKKYPDKVTTLDVLKKFIIDDNNVDTSALLGLDPIIQQGQKVVDALVNMKIPSSLAPLHLDFLNAAERLLENTVDLKIFDIDPIVTMSAMSNYEKNKQSLKSALLAIKNYQN